MGKYTSLQVPKEDPKLFIERMTGDRSSWFLEVGEIGLIYFTQVLPYHSATMHVLFWDGKLPKQRIAIVQQGLKMAFKTLDLLRVGVTFRWNNTAFKRFLKDAGFVYEGTVRRGWIDHEGAHDMLLFGVIKEEL
jgi:RimJ/RimL family protein N-acetyltransferase